MLFMGEGGWSWSGVVCEHDAVCARVHATAQDLQGSVYERCYDRVSDGTTASLATHMPKSAALKVRTVSQTAD